MMTEGTNLLLLQMSPIFTIFPYNLLINKG